MKSLRIFIISLLATQILFEIVCIFGGPLELLGTIFAPCSIVVPFLKGLAIILSYDIPKDATLFIVISLAIICVELIATVCVCVKKHFFIIIVILFHLLSIVFCAVWFIKELLYFDEYSVILLVILGYKFICSLATSILLIVLLKKSKEEQLNDFLRRFSPNRKLVDCLKVGRLK